MSLRIACARALIRTGRFIESLAVAVMRPDDLVAFTRRTYSRPGSVGGWADDRLVDAGLSPDESALLERIPFRSGRLLLLGIGGGREAIPLAKMGFEVTGVDFVPELVAAAERNALERGVRIKGLVQDISRLDTPPAAFDLAWLTSGTYSSIPTRDRRRGMLGRIHAALVPGGFFLCQFLIGRSGEVRETADRLRKAFAWLTLGNLRYERGDGLAGGIEFVHYFRSEDDIRREFAGSGFEAVAIAFPAEGARGGAVLRKIR